MLTFCPKCVYPNQPYKTVCERCGYTLRTPEDARQQQEEWDRLPPATRAEFEDKYKAEQARYNMNMALTFRQKTKYLFISAGILTALGMLNGALIISDIVVGGIAGWLLIKRKGGPHRGMIYFIGAYIISYIFKWQIGWAYAEPFGNPLLTYLFLYSCLIVICLGYLIGSHIYYKHFASGI